jgi:PAS domain S-box-containing protein
MIKTDINEAVNLHCLLSVTDENGIIIDANRKFCETTGYSLEEIKGQKHSMFKSNQHPKAFYEDLWKTISTGNIWQSEICDLNKAGEEWWAETTILPQMDEHGKIYQYVSVKTHIRKPTAESPHLPRNIIRDVSNEIVLFNEDTLRIVDVNAKVCCNTGYVEDGEFEKLTLLDILSEYDNDGIQEIVSKAKYRNETVEFETVVERKDGTYYDALVRVQNYQKEDNNTFVASIKDLTQQKKHEMEISQAKKMEVLSEVTSNIAHDFNNLLATILGFNKLIEMQSISGEFDRNKILNYSKNIVDAGNKSKELVASMVEFSKKADRDMTKYKLYELSGLVEESLDLLSAVLPSDITLSKKLDSNLHVKTNNIKLHQIIMNLCLNAKDAIDQTDGTIEVGVRIYTDEIDKCTSCRENLQGSYIELYVKDNGKGISQEKLKDIFKPYYTTKSDLNGTGTGLSTVHKIMHEHEGHIVVKSIPQVGSVFSMLFPFVEQPAHENDEETEYKPMPGGGRQLLIVDDQPALGLFLQDLTKEHGYEPIYFQDGNQAYDYYVGHHNEISAVITDMGMPGMNGVELVKKIFEITSDPKVIVCSGNVAQIDFNELPKTCAVLPKPINISDFFQELDSLIY